jgi:hypothetical protein
MNGYIEDFRYENGVVHVRLWGTFPNELLNSGKNLFQPLVDECLAHNCKNALIDARDLQVNFSTMAIFQAGEDAAAISNGGLHVAILAREDMLDPLFEDVAFNRGGNIGVFTDMNAALAWLQG